jgi:O-methyltransferase
MIERLLQRIANRLGVELRRYHPSASRKAFPPDFDEDTINTILAVREATMTSPERIAALCAAVRYVVRYRVPGALVECGVWRGGSMKAAALTLLAAGDRERELYLLDTFAGLPPPGDRDGGSALAYFQDATRKGDVVACCNCSLEQVRQTMYETGYPPARIHFVPGRVEDTLPAAAPAEIALLRLDTDWYESTRCELEHLFPRLSRGGVLILDDYGHWEGARRAVDEYFAKHEFPLLLNRIDDTGRIGVVTGIDPRQA